MKIMGNIGNTDAGSFRVQLRCPHCLRIGVLEALTQPDLTFTTPVDGKANTVHSCRAGLRRCTNPNCLQHIFFLAADNKIVETYPAERIDFDSAAVPQKIVETFGEAISCYSQRCYIAAAIMVRRTLEEICDDRKATGNNLRERIEALGSKVILPTELLDAAHELRLFGNDAAHIEARLYDAIDHVACSLALDVTKEILKAVYQYAELVQRLRALQKPPGAPAS